MNILQLQLPFSVSFGEQKKSECMVIKKIITFFDETYCCQQIFFDINLKMCAGVNNKQNQKLSAAPLIVQMGACDVRHDMTNSYVPVSAQKREVSDSHMKTPV